MSTKNQITVLDLFAGPGGLGEGFARFPYDQAGEPKFSIKLSVEKDARAHSTLFLRCFLRQFSEDKIPGEYFRQLQDLTSHVDTRLRKLFEQFPEQAKAATREAICAELGNLKYKAEIESAASAAVDKQRHWVLLGGPPCQAYSLVGRSRNQANANYDASNDKRQFLYSEYLRIVADHLPSVFVMENVKGLLSATVNNERVFETIVGDLRDPRKAIGSTISRRRGVKTTYRLFSVVASESHGNNQLSDFVVKMEDFGIPQARHRLIILGVREDLGVESLPSQLKWKKMVPAKSVLADLPVLRSGLSQQPDSESLWRQELNNFRKSEWFSGLANGKTDIKKVIRNAIAESGKQNLDRGADFVKGSTSISYLPEWYSDFRIEGVFNHETRSHIRPDLARYLFASCFAQVNQYSPVLNDFPSDLLPNHKNVVAALNGSLFADRFRVQLADRPSTTITCHISKDGHYYIHPDPAQCRSLTVREAARLQTFPDNYFFCGPPNIAVHPSRKRCAAVLGSGLLSLLIQMIRLVSVFVGTKILQ